MLRISLVINYQQLALVSRNICAALQHIKLGEHRRDMPKHEPLRRKNLPQVPRLDFRQIEVGVALQLAQDTDIQDRPSWP